MNSLKLKRGDFVKITTGSHKGKTGKIVAVVPSKNAVKIEGIGVVKRHVKPNVVQPQGGVQELHKSIDASKVALVVDTKAGKTSRIGYTKKKTGEKIRVALQAKNKEIDA
jgi:large subunit ribosomal protein L24